jgi:hypothetical protein
MLLAIFICILIVIAFVYTIKQKAEKYDLIKQKEKERDNFFYMKENNIPPDANSCFIMSDEKVPAYTWKEKESLNLFENNQNKTIPINDIKYYTRNGDYNIQTVIEGGGISISKAILGSIVGAIIGFLIFSTGGLIIGIGVGALLAGKEKTVTKQQELDKRQTFLYYNEENIEKHIILDSSAYDTFINLIPNKNFEYIQQQKLIN